MENPEERSSKFNKWVYYKASFQTGGEKKGGRGEKKGIGCGKEVLEGGEYMYTYGWSKMPYSRNSYNIVGQL